MTYQGEVSSNLCLGGSVPAWCGAVLRVGMPPFQTHPTGSAEAELKISQLDSCRADNAYCRSVTNPDPHVIPAIAMGCSDPCVSG